MALTLKFVLKIIQGNNSLLFLIMLKEQLIQSNKSVTGTKIFKKGLPAMLLKSQTMCLQIQKSPP